MKILTFQASRFWWKSHSRTLDDAQEDEVEREVRDAVVAFLHVEAGDVAERSSSVFKKTLKHIKWLANKRELRNVVLHSFTHLGGDTAPPDFAGQFLQDLAERLRATDYDVDITPFGWFCQWELAVFGDSLAKVWKEI